MTEPENNEKQRVQQLLALRVIWGALIAGPVAFLVVALILKQHGPHDMASFDPRGFEIACLAALIAFVPTSYLVRSILYGSSDPGGGIPIGRYFSGNLVFWAMNEGVAFFAIVCMYLHGQPLPFLAFALIPLANQIANFPTGNPLQPPT